MLGHAAQIFNMKTTELGLTEPGESGEANTHSSALASAIPYFAYQQASSGPYSARTDQAAVERLAQSLSKANTLVECTREWPYNWYWDDQSLSELICTRLDSTQFDPLRAWVRDGRSIEVTLRRIKCQTWPGARTVDPASVKEGANKFRFKDPARLAEAILQTASGASDGEEKEFSVNPTWVNEERTWDLGTHKVDFMKDDVSLGEGDMKVEWTVNGRVYFYVSDTSPV